jgi:hypothetical protein
MNLISIIQAAIDAHPDADGLCNDELGCGCTRDDLAPCAEPVFYVCALARSETLTEPRGDCGVGDLWFTAVEGGE